MAGPVIVGVDGSDTAARAAEVAATLARQLQRPLRVVTAYEKVEVDVIEVGTDVFEVRSDEEARKIAETVAAKVAPDLPVEVAAVQGKPADVLIDEATEHGASLLVVGNRRMQGVSRLLGSVANSVSHHAPCDVYIVKTT